MKNSLFAFAMAAAFLLSGSSALAAYQLPGPVSVDTVYQAGQGSVDFSKSAEVRATFTITGNSFGQGTWITAGDVAHGASGFGFYADDRGGLYTVSSGGGYITRIFSDFFAPGRTITVSAKYDANAHNIRFDTQTWNPVLDSPEYGRGIIEDNIPAWSEHAADALRVLLNPNYTSTGLQVATWSYTD